MKKVIFSLISILALIFMTPIVHAENDVKVYMFTKNGCSACEAAFGYLEPVLEENPDAFELINIEVWCGSDYTQTNYPWILGNQDAFNLMQKVLEHFGESTSKISTPTIIVGNNIQVGARQDIVDLIEAQKTASDYQDVVAELANELDLDIASMTKEHGAASCDIVPEPKENNNKYDLLIVAGIFVVLIGGFAGLVVISKK